LEADHKVIGIPDETDPAFTRPGKASREPQIKAVMKIDIGEQGRDDSALCKVSNYAK
jgi:hypothetical protein